METKKQKIRIEEVDGSELPPAFWRDLFALLLKHGVENEGEVPGCQQEEAAGPYPDFIDGLAKLQAKIENQYGLKLSYKMSEIVIETN